MKVISKSTIDNPKSLNRLLKVLNKIPKSFFENSVVEVSVKTNAYGMASLMAAIKNDIAKK